MKNISRAAVIGVGVCLTATFIGYSPDAGAAPARYKVTRLSNIPGGYSSYPVAINAAGEVSGTSYDNAGCASGCPVFWSDKTPKLLGKLPKFQYGGVSGMNDLGQVVGYEYVGNNDDATSNDDAVHPDVGFHGRSHAVVWTDSIPTILGQLPGDWPNNGATSINNAGEVVGFTHNAEGYDRALLWHGTKPKELPTQCYFGALINGPGLIACTTKTQDVSVDNAGKVTLLPQLGDNDSNPSAVNDTGLIVGLSTTGVGETHAVVWEYDRIHDINPEGVPYSTANAIDAQGHIVGGAITTNDEYLALYWPSPSSKPQNLKKLISAHDAARIQLYEAVAINDQCSIVALGTEGKSTNTYGYKLTLNPGFACQ